MIPVPNLDDRSHKEIVEEAMRLIPRYCPDWTNFNPSDPGVTLIELFAWMMEMAIYRLNKVTDKNYIAFLNMMGVRLQPPQSARTLLRFQLVKSAPPTWIKRETPIATAQSGKEEPVIFETTEELLISGVRLLHCFTQVSDVYTDQSPFLDGRRGEGFEVFTGINHIERCLYLGDPSFEQVNEDSILVINISSAGSSQVVDLLEWEYWNGRRWRELRRSQNEVEEGSIAFEYIDSIEELEINEETSFWIRGRLSETPPDPNETFIDSVKARVEVRGEGIALDSAYVNIDSAVFLTVDTQRSWAPFGKEPRAENILYLLAETFPTQTGSVLRIDLRLAETKLKDPPQPSEDLILIWEYSDGKRWRRLGRSTVEGAISAPDVDFIDGTRAFTQSGELSFRRPEDLAEVEVQNEPGCWLRVRIESGDFGIPGHYELSGERWIWQDERPLRPPWVQSLSFRYTEKEKILEKVLSYNDFSYSDHTLSAHSALKRFQAFEPSSEDSPTLYLGFDAAFPNERMSLYFKMVEQVSQQRERAHREYLGEYYAERDRAIAREQRVVWEYWDGRHWADLDPEDQTQAFTESGFLYFIGPEDHKRLKRFGQIAYWFRVRLEMGGYHLMPRISCVISNAVYAHHQTTVRDEILGTSDGTPNQSFNFARGPLLEGQRLLVRERERPEGEALQALKLSEELKEARGGGYWIPWAEIESFYDSGPKSRHYIIDRVQGRLRFGDGRKGMIPPAASSNIMAKSYRVGGGLRGNITARSLKVLRKSIAHVDAVSNPFSASGGSDQESIEEAKSRGPHMIKSRNRAVTAEDFQWLSLQASNGIARAKCLNSSSRGGEVVVVIVPKQDARHIDLSLKLLPSTELLRRVKHFLDERRLITTIVNVQRPRYVEISVRVEIIRSRVGSSDKLKRNVEERLRSFLHPLVGGRDGEGWPFGRNLLKLDLYHVIEGIDGVDMVHRIHLYDEDRKRPVEQLKVADDELIYLVDVEVIEKPREQFR